jgi:hypothetical protein
VKRLEISVAAEKGILIVRIFHVAADAVRRLKD